ATINPAPDASGWNNSPVTVSFNCSDSLSGVASCSSPVSVTNEITGDVITGTAADVAGNTASTSVTVNISFNYFLIRSYGGKCLDYGISPSGDRGVFLNDCPNAHPVRVAEVNANHDVLLYAGNSVIGINIPQTITT